MGLSEKPGFRKFLVKLAGKKHYKEFNKKSHNVEKVQADLLVSFVNDAKDTAFGKDYGFDKIKDKNDFRKKVPISTFEDHRPYIERMMKGESDILVKGKPMMYNTTSGTTSKPKMIPITEDYLKKSVSSINRLWLYSSLLENPDIYNGKSLSYVAPDVEGYVEDGTPFGSISGVSMKNIPNVLKSTYSAPYPIMCIKDYDKKFYAIVRYALCEDISIIIALNPLTYLRFHQTIMDNFSDLLEDIHNGTMRQDVADSIAEGDRDECLAQLKSNPERAMELEKLMEDHGENLRFKHYWPNIACINIWKQGNFKIMLKKLEGFFPEKTVWRAFGYQASEGRAGVILKNDWLYSAAAIHIYYFEFIREKDKDMENPPVFLAHELKKGEKYYILFSNGSGLFRYDMNDIIEVCGFYNEVPLFKFIQKGEGITSLTGEKLSEIQVIEGIKLVSENTDIHVENYLMYCDYDEQNYKLFIEYGKDTNKDIKKSFAVELDKILKELNLEYEVKRGTGRLNIPLIFELKENSQEQLKVGLIKKGKAREGQYKNVYLTKKKAIYDELKTLIM